MATKRSAAVINGPSRAVETGVNSITGEYSQTDTLSAGDIIEMVRIPDGGTVLDIIATMPNVDGDSPVVPTVLAIGDGISRGRYASGSANGQIVRAGSPAGRAGGVPYTVDLSDNDPIGYDTIDFQVVNGAKSGTSNGVLKLTALYTMDK